MQLISIVLFTLSLIVLGGALAFITKWYRTRQAYNPAHLLQEGIEYIGISAIIEYPETTQPLFALLNEEYPHSEVILIADLQRHHATFGALLQKYHLIRVNHSHIDNVRALYRSRHRTFRRVVMVDLPIEHRQSALSVGGKVASFGYLLHLRGESIVARNTLAYCANIIASHRLSDDISLHSFLGEEVYITRCDSPAKQGKSQIISNRILAWHKRGRNLSFGVLALPAITLLLSHLMESRLLMITAEVVLCTITLLIYIACCTATERSIFATFDAICVNFYLFFIKEMKQFYKKLLSQRIFRRLYFTTRSVSKIRDTPRDLVRALTQNRPARYRANSQREQ